MSHELKRNDTAEKRERIHRKKSRVRKLSSGVESLENAKYKYVANVGAELAPGVVLVNEIKIGTEDPVLVRAHPHGIQWIIGYNSGKIRIFDLTLEKPHDDATGNQYEHALIEPPSTNEKHIVTDIRFFHDKNAASGKGGHHHIKLPLNTKMVITHASGHIRVLEYRCRNPCVFRILSETQEESSLNLNEKFNSVLCTSVSYDNERIITGGADCKIRVYDKHLDLLVVCRQSDLPEVMDGHAMRVLGLAYHPLGMAKPEYQHIFISGGWDDTIMIWDDRKSQSLFQYHGPHICSNDAFDIEPVNNLLITANWSRDKPMYYIYRFNAMVVSETHYESVDLEKEYSTPVTTYLGDPHNQVKCMAYVGKWLSPDVLLVAGGNEPLVSVLSKDRSETISCITTFDNSIISADFRKKSKGGVHLCLCCGDTLMSVVFDKSAVTRKTRK